MPNNDKESAVLNVSDCASILGISRGSVYKGCATGDIHHIKIGRRILIPKRAIETLLNGGNTNSNITPTGTKIHT